MCWYYAQKIRNNLKLYFSWLWFSVSVIECHLFRSLSLYWYAHVVIGALFHWNIVFVYFMSQGRKGIHHLPTPSFPITKSNKVIVLFFVVEEQIFGQQVSLLEKCSPSWCQLQSSWRTSQGFKQALLAHCCWPQPRFNIGFLPFWTRRVIWLIDNQEWGIKID